MPPVTRLCASLSQPACVAVEPRTGDSFATAINNAGVVVGFDQLGAQRFR